MADIKDLTAVGMGDPSGNDHFAFEPGQLVLVLGKVGMKNLERALDFQNLVQCTKNLAKTSLSKKGGQMVARSKEPARLKALIAGNRDGLRHEMVLEETG